MSGRFKTLETVPIDTRAARATSLMLAEVRAMSPHPLDPPLSAVPSALPAERPLEPSRPPDPAAGHPAVNSDAAPPWIDCSHRRRPQPTSGAAVAHSPRQEQTAAPPPSGADGGPARAGSGVAGHEVGLQLLLRDSVVRGEERIYAHRAHPVAGDPHGAQRRAGDGG